MKIDEMMAIISIAITAFIWYSYLSKKTKRTN